MKRNRKTMYLSTTTLRGRRLKDTAEPGGATPSAGESNAGGNPPTGATPGGESNNGGQDFDPASFWTGPAPSPAASPSGGSVPGNESVPGNQQPSLQETLSTQLESMLFGDPIFDQAIAAEINEGNFEGVQKRFESMMQTGVRQAMQMNVQILRPFAEQMMNQMREEFSSTMNGRDNEESLVKDFPVAKDPKIAPIVQQIYTQALKNTNNDRTKAVANTKEMLRVMAGVTADDLQLTVAPRGEGDYRPHNTDTNWLDEMTSR